MRSAEQSGVEAGGLAPDSGAGHRAARWPAEPRWLRETIGDLSSATLAVTAVALAAATLYAISETLPALQDTTSQPGGVWLRIAAGYALALVAIGFSLHRHRPAVLEELAGYRDLLEILPFGVACWTREAKLSAWNERLVHKLRAVGETLTLMRGASYQEVISALSREGDMQLVREDAQNRLLELHRTDGATLLIEERPLEAGGFVTMVMDVTETRRTSLLLSSVREEQRQLARRYHEEKIRAEAASRSKTTFLAHLSHDIRTPLNHIIGFADMIRQQPFGSLGDARYLGYVEAVKGSGERLLGFFGSILELAELEGGRRELRRERFTADDLLVRVLRRFSTQAQRAGLTLGLGGACEAQLQADRFALERMVTNIVENAFRFTPRGGKVTLAAYAASDGIVIEISDTGIGIAPERLETLSQPFAFSDAALSRDRDGAGLGIAIARAIAELSGGRLAIDSRPGLGTTVAISLPIAEGEETASRSKAA
jgi:two-component system cell cycle sensor histidine kinase PleC